MAPNPERQELRELNTRLKLKSEELNRLKEEVKELRDRRKALKDKLSEDITVE